MFLFHDKSTYQGYLKQYFPDAPSRKALFVKERGLGMVFAYEGDQFEVDLRHECTHALLNAMLPVTPLWLDEGLAEYFEVTSQERADGNPHWKYVKWSAYLAQTPRLEDLEQTRDLSQMTRTRYRHAWAWVHFMLHGPPEARAELQHFLADIQALTPPGLLSDRLRGACPTWTPASRNTSATGSRDRDNVWSRTWLHAGEQRGDRRCRVAGRCLVLNMAPRWRAAW